MRMTRAFTLVLAITMLAPRFAEAQANRQFRDAWFWGVKAGSLGYAKGTADPAAYGNYSAAPLVGAEWLMTRTRGGLYTSLSQAFLSQQALIANSPSPNDTTVRVVDLKNVRRFEMALMAFPGTHIRLHPYVGVGFSFNAIGSAEPQGTFRNAAEAEFADAVVQQFKSVVTPMVIAGGQYRFSMVSAFAQATAGPANRDWLLYNGRPINFSFELGLRYNVGTSIER